MYSVAITSGVLDALRAEAPALEERFFHFVDLIGSFPEMGGEYIPEDGADDLPFPCRCYPIPSTSKTVFYRVDHEGQKVTVFALIDQRRNPAYRFREARQSENL